MATINAASLSSSDVQSAINSASDGDTVVLPSGSATWTSGVTISGKGIKIQGAGGGRVEGSSTSSLAIGTGSKSFTLASGSVVSSGFTVGETVRAVYKAAGTNYMEGTVTSWNGTTLVLNATSTGGSGTRSAWTFVVAPETTITHNCTSSDLFDVTEDATNSVEFSRFCIVQQASTTDYHSFDVHDVSSGKPIIWHDIRRTGAVNGSFIHASRSRGLLYRVYFDAGFDFSSVKDVFGIRIKNTNPNNGGWNSVNTMGADDTDGTNNIYVENCYAIGCGLLTDWDDNARGVFRYSCVDNSSCASHGPDTSYHGGMHVEYYNNLFVFNDLSSDTLNLQAFIESRGGTGLVADNVIPDITSGMWGGKAEIKMQLQMLDRSAGPFALWGQYDSGAQYPCPRQVGMGHANSGYTSHDVTASWSGRTAVDINLTTGLDTNTTPCYLGDLCPWHQWGNSGGGNYANPSIEMSGYNTGTPDDPDDYFQVGRDWINGALSGYEKFSYPHPLRNSTLAGPANVRWRPI